MAKRSSRPSFQSYLEFEGEFSLVTDQSQTLDRRRENELWNSITDWVVLDDTTGKPRKDEAKEDGEDLLTFQDEPPKPGNGATVQLQIDDLLGPLEETVKEGGVNAKVCNRQIKTEEKLCGYLNKFKVGRRGRMFKRRWFVFSDASCQLLYFRKPGDLIPLGEIEVSRASFTFDADSGNKCTTFKIRSGGQTYCLEAADKTTMMYWLQELQSKRRNFSTKKAKLGKLEEQTVTVPVKYSTDSQTDCGLASLVPQLSESGDHGKVPLLDQVETPQATVGLSAAGTGNRAKLKDLSFANLRTELRNVVRNLQFRKLERTPSGKSTGTATPSPLITPGEELPPLLPFHDHSGQNSGRMALLRDKVNKLRPKTVGSELDAVNMHQCGSCKQVKRELISIEDELEATREVVKVLQRQVDLLQTQMQTVTDWHSSSAQTEEMSLLHSKDKQIVELEHLLCANQQDAAVIMHNMNALEREVQGLKEELTLYKESTQKKDEMIMNMSTRLLELENAPENAHSTGATLIEGESGHGLDQREQQTGFDWSELEMLRDRCHGYERQNQFMNSEIMELQQLRQDDEAREKQLLMKSTEMEAKYYQVKSKHLSLLRELNNTKGQTEDEEGPYPHDLVCRLLQEAIDMDTEEGLPYGHTSLIGSYPHYDKYGFQLMPLSMTDDASLGAQVTDLQRRSEELNSLNLDKEISHKVKWENYLVGLGNKELFRSPELKALVRGGIPPQHRPRMWRACINWWIGRYREGYRPDYYEKLLARANNPNNKVDPAFKQIELDLLRTLPNNKHFESMTSSGMSQLRNVLQAYIQHNPNIGYCQGLNRLVAIALLILQEEEAFWCLVAIAEMILPPEYYSTTLLDAQVDQRVLKELVAEKLPRLHAHLEKNNVDLSLFTFNWFLTIYVDNIPVETFMRVWDTFLYEGNKVLFRYALAILKYREDDLLRKQGVMAIQTYMRTIGENATNINAISQIAFEELNPFPMRNIANKRQIHTQHVKNQLAELNELRGRWESSDRHRDLLSDEELGD